MKRHEVYSRVGLSVAGVLAVGGLARIITQELNGNNGINDQPVSLSGSCQELSQDGRVLHPRSYPSDRVGVQYELVKDNSGNIYGQSFDGEFDQTTGFITGSNGNYRLTIPKLPPVEYMGNNHSNFGPDVAIVINGPSQEQVGFTGACVVSGVIAGKNSIVTLPPIQK